MKIKKSKQGAVILYGLLAGLFAAFLIAYIDIVTTEKEFPLIGQSSKKLLDSSNKAEKAFLYVEQAAKNSVHQAIYDLAQIGGCKSAEKYLSNSLWNDKCKQKPRENFEDILTTKLNSLLLKYKEIELPENNYMYDYDNNVIGIAKNPIEIIIKKNEREIGKQLIKPSFKVNLDYDFSDYDLLRKNASKLMEVCNGKANVEFCINNNKFDIFNNDNFELIETCESEEKENFLEFVEYVQSCVNSEIPDMDQESPGCPCRKKPEGNYHIEQQGNNIEVTTINEKYSMEIDNVKLRIDSKEIKNDIILHKVSPDGILIERDFDPNAASCNIKPKTNFRFCVKSKNNKFYAYDDDQVALRDLTYKFALQFEAIETEESLNLQQQLNKKSAELRKKLISIGTECTSNKDKLSDIGKGVMDTFEDKIDTPVLFKTCDSNEEAINTMLEGFSKLDSISLILSSGENQVISYSTDEAKLIAENLLEALNKDDNTKFKLEKTDDALFDSVKITFKDSELNNDDKIIQYSEYIALGIVSSVP